MAPASATVVASIWSLIQERARMHNLTTISNRIAAPTYRDLWYGNMYARLGLARRLSETGKMEQANMDRPPPMTAVHSPRWDPRWGWVS